MKQGMKRNIYKQGKYIRGKQKNKLEIVIEGIILNKSRQIIDVVVCKNGHLLTERVNRFSYKDVFIGDDEDIIIWLIKNNIDQKMLIGHISGYNWISNLRKILLTNQTATISI